MNDVLHTINEILDRKAHYGGSIFLVKIANIHREIRKRKVKGRIRVSSQELTHLITQEIIKRGGVHWGHLWDNDSYNRDKHPLNQIYQIRKKEDL